MFQHLPKVPLQTVSTAFRNPHTIQRPEIPMPTRSLFSPLKLADAHSGVVQRTIYKFTDKKWVPYCKMKILPNKKPPKTLDAKEGDYYDAAKMKFLTASEVLRGRMTRARERMEGRAKKRIPARNLSELYAFESMNERHRPTKKDTNDTSIKVKTPFGIASVSRSIFNGAGMKDEKQPYVRDEDRTPSDYTSLSKTLDTIQDDTGQLKGRVMGGIMKFFKTPTKDPAPFESEDLKENQKKALTLFCTIAGVAEPHMTRNPDGGKTVRAGVKLSGDETFSKLFNTQAGLFLQSRRRGNKLNREFLAGGDSHGMEALLDDMSESSDDEKDINLFASQKLPSSEMEIDDVKETKIELQKTLGEITDENSILGTDMDEDSGIDAVKKTKIRRKLTKRRMRTASQGLIIDEDSDFDAEKTKKRRKIDETTDELSKYEKPQKLSRSDILHPIIIVSDSDDESGEDAFKPSKHELESSDELFDIFSKRKKLSGPNETNK